MEHPAAIPNQEIVLEFQENFNNATHSSDFIRDITKRLNGIGISDVRIFQTGSNSFRILYFSDLDVLDVQDILHEEVNKPASDIPGSFPDQNPFLYKLEIVKIKDNTLFENSFQGTIVETKSVQDQYLKPKLPVASVLLNDASDIFTQRVETDNFILQVPVPELVDYSFPEVRAGPAA